jgi:DNA-binding NarL/FixJ family response regulator
MGTTVLIVDDHPTFRSSARSVLEADGFVVVGEAGDGDAAIAAADRLRPDVVLLDVQLPDMDGFEIAKRLKLSGDAPAIVLTSSRDAAEYGSAVADSEVCGFIPKAELSGAAIADLLAT